MKIKCLLFSGLLMMSMTGCMYDNLKRDHKDWNDESGAHERKKTVELMDPLTWIKSNLGGLFVWDVNVTAVNLAPLPEPVAAAPAIAVDDGVNYYWDGYESLWYDGSQWFVLDLGSHTWIIPNREVMDRWHSYQQGHPDWRSRARPFKYGDHGPNQGNQGGDGGGRGPGGDGGGQRNSPGGGPRGGGGSPGGRGR